MKKVTVFSLIFNFLFIVLGAFIFVNVGGVNYLKNKLTPNQQVNKQQNSDSWNTRVSIYNSLPIKKESIIFLGNSIIDNCEWNELLDNPNVINRGIGGDRISMVIERMDEVINAKPKQIFLLIGINDLHKNRTVKEVLKDYKQLINLIREKTPDTELYIHSILPVFNRDHINKEDIKEINRNLRDWSTVFGYSFIDIHSIFKDGEDKMKNDFTFDGVHPNGKGYLIWKKEIDRYITD